MNNLNYEKIISDQKSQWDIAAPAWEKWDDWFEINMKEINARLLELVQIRSDHKALDLGCGTGQLAVQAGGIVGDQGAVTGLDLSEKMLSVARRKSANADNVDFKTCDLGVFPFADEGFDVVVSKFCLMFLPCVDETLKESFRVLKPKGVMASVVWGSVNANPMFTIPVGVIEKFIKMPPPDPDAPSLFALSEPGRLKRMMETAGFTDVEEEEFHFKWEYSSAGHFVEGVKDLAAPLRALMDRLTPEQLRQVEDGMAETVGRFRENGKIILPGSALIVSGAKAGSA